jgi:hypothetical protein
VVQSHSKMRPEGHRREDPLGHPLRRATAEEEASQAAGRGLPYATHRRFQVFSTRIHHIIPGGRQIETATGTLTATDETGGHLLPDARQRGMCATRAIKETFLPATLT